MNFAIYSRKSYYSDTSESTKMQVEACRDYIDRSFDDVDTITPYEDDGYIRSDIDRPAMNQLRQDVADGLIDCVVIYRIDRVCSNMMDFCTFYTFLKEREIKFITVKDGIDTTTPIGEAMMYLAVIFSGIEISNDTLRITDNMNHLAAAGFWCGGQPPLGYKIQEISTGKKSHKTLVPDPAALEYKNMLIEILLDNRFSLQQMETYCRQQGIRSYSSGSFLSTTQLHQILSSPMCVADTVAMYDYFESLGCMMDEGSPREKWDGRNGIIVYGRTTEKRVNGKKRHVKAPVDKWRISIGVHEPTMEPEQYFEIMKHFGQKKFDKKMKHETTLLKGVLRCKCGRLMSLARKPKADGSVSTWYHCPRREREGVASCDSKAIKAELLDEKVLEIFREIEHDPEVIRQYMKQEEKKPAGSTDALRKQILENGQKIDRLTATLAENGSSAAAKYIIAQIEKLDIEQIELNRKLAEQSVEVRRQQARLRGAMEKRMEITRLLENFDEFTMEEKNEIARTVIQSATWDNEALFLTL